jgi:hypothetical protein
VDIGVRGGPPAVRELLDALCELTPSREAGVPLVPASLSRPGGRGGCLAVVLARPWQPDLAAVAALRPHYSTTVLVALESGSPVGVEPRVPGARLLRAADARQAARRWNVVVPG